MYRLLIILLVSGVSTNEIYSNKTVNGDFYSKECCHPIKNLKIPTKVKECTQELFVYFMCNDIEKAGFLTKHKEILNSNAGVLCSDEKIDLIDWDDLFIQKINDVVIVEAKRLTFWYHARDFIRKSFDDVNDYCYAGFIVLNNLLVIIFFVYLQHKRSKSTTENTIAAVHSLKGGFALPLKATIQSCNIQLETTCSCSKGEEPCNGRYPCSCRTAGKDCTKECHGGRKVNCCNN